MQILKVDITTELEENYAYTPSSSYFLWRARNYHSNILPELDTDMGFGSLCSEQGIWSHEVASVRAIRYGVDIA